MPFTFSDPYTRRQESSRVTDNRFVHRPIERRQRDVGH
jgi:hypothetical protein